jgi:dihydroxyacetone kinase
MELGLGIHGEAGVKRAKVKPADEIVAIMLDHLVNSQSYLSLTAGDQVAVVVNNLGGTSRLEMSIIARAVIQYLVQTKSIAVERCYVGSYMTSLEMAGVSVTVLHVDDVLLQCLDYPTDVPGWSHLSEPASYQPGQCLVKGRSPQAQPIHTLTNETDRESTTSNNELGS